MNAAACMTFN